MTSTTKQYSENPILPFFFLTNQPFSMMWNFVQALLLATLIRSSYSFTPISTHLSRGMKGTTITSWPLMAAIESVELVDRFDRWRFLQRLLDLEVDNDVAKEIVLKILDNSLKRPKSVDPEDDEGMTAITPALREKITTVVMKADDPFEALSSVEILDSLLPTMDEDEDAVTSLWDIVTEIHGGEVMKMDEAEGSPEWKLACIQARVLLHFDFLTEGI